MVAKRRHDYRQKSVNQIGQTFPLVVPVWRNVSLSCRNRPAELRAAEGKLYLFVAIDRTSKFAFVELHEKATPRIAADFLIALTKAVPYKIHTVLTDNGTHFTDPGGDTWTPTEIKQRLAQGRPFRAHASPAHATTSIIG